MNISPDGVSIRFKTEPKDLFEAEKAGAKSNIVRILDFDEWRLLKKSDPSKIIIQHQQEIFLRTLTHIHFGGVILGKVIAIFSWTNEKTIKKLSVSGPHSVPFEPGNHNLRVEDVMSPIKESSLDKTFAAITVSRSTFTLLQSISHGRSMNSVIRELFEAVMDHRSDEVEPSHD